MEHLTPTERIYKAFYDSKQAKLYYNQLIELTNSSDSSLQNALKKLKQNDELDIEKQKANTFYILKDKQIKNLIFTKFDLEKINHLNSEVNLTIKKFLSKMPKQGAFVILFGSSSRKEENEDSDIDLLIVLHTFEGKLQKAYETQIKKEFKKTMDEINAISTHSINAFYTNTDNFINSNDRLIIEAKTTGFCIAGNEIYYGLKDE